MKTLGSPRPLTGGFFVSYGTPTTSLVKRLLVASRKEGVCAKDVCDALGYKQTHKAVDRYVDKEDVLKWNTPTISGDQLMLYVNESGLYTLIMGSKLESARRFKHWVTSEVLPAIRKRGSYMVAHTDESDKVIMARALQIMQATLERRDAEIARLISRADFANHMLDSMAAGD